MTASAGWSADLEAAIAANPDDEDAYLVYADGLQMRGDPRGTLIALQVAAEHDRGAWPRADEYLSEHLDVFLGTLIEHVAEHDPLFRLEWRYGFIRRATIRMRNRFVAGATGWIEQLVEHPSARFLRELVFDIRDSVDNQQRLVDMLARHRFPSLRVLELGEVGYGHFDRDPPGPALELSALWPAVASIEQLAVRGEIDDGHLPLPALRRLAIQADTLPEDRMLEIVASPLRRLERLDVRLPYVPWQYDPSPPLAALLTPLVPQLRHLGVSGVQYHTDRLTALLARLPLQLEALDLPNNRLTDDDARHLATSWWRVEILDVTRNVLTAKGIAALQAVAKLVVGEDQLAR
ncbi:MAG TPA: TIGR02996 domain-containing protein [Kofleriaceae bacterium]|nr:TIGR02996 domain-containing protein [Kofleriaceae bacterium]